MASLTRERVSNFVIVNIPIEAAAGFVIWVNLATDVSPALKALSVAFCFPAAIVGGVALGVGIMEARRRRNSVKRSG